jgi:hypothetical protein
MMATQAGDAYDRAERLLRTTVRNTVWLAHILCGSGMVSELVGDLERAKSRYDEAVAIFDHLDDPYGRAKLVHCHGRLAARSAAHDQAIEMYRR